MQVTHLALLLNGQNPRGVDQKEKERNYVQCTQQQQQQQQQVSWRTIVSFSIVILGFLYISDNASRCLKGRRHARAVT